MDVLYQKVSLQGTEFLQVKAEHIKYTLKFCEADSWKAEVFIPRQMYRNSAGCVHGPLSSFSFSCHFQGNLEGKFL